MTDPEAAAGAEGADGEGEKRYRWVLTCPCGSRLVGGSEDEIVDVSFAHLAEQHPEMADAYEREHVLFMAVKFKA